MHRDREVSMPLVSLEHRKEDKENQEDLESPTFQSPPGRRFKPRTPLPLLQLTILCGVRLAEPIAYTQIFPVSLCMRAL